jgi:hypothetical protein
LIVAAWQAPLPFCHAHGTLANAVVAPWLAKHLRTCHADVDPRSPLVFGWHLHLALPDAGDDAPDAPQPNRQQILVTAGFDSWEELSRLQSPAVLWSHGDAAPASCALLGGDALDDIRRPGGFFADFAPDMPLPVRLGVLRC